MTSDDSQPPNYEMLTEIEHVLQRPAVSLGQDPKTRTETVPVFDCDNQLCNRQVTYSWGLCKIFDEILVNAVDQWARNRGVTYINVTVTDDTITIENNGATIPVVVNETYGKYNAEIVFGYLRSSENYNDQAERFTGGLNGLGAKCTNILSTRFEVHLGDPVNKKQCDLVYQDNMSRSNIRVSNYKSTKSFTRIVFRPDFPRLDIAENKITGDNLLMLQRRTFEMGTYTTKCKVTFNGTSTPFTSPELLVKSIVGIVEESAATIKTKDSNWRIGVGISKTPSQALCVGLVNGVRIDSGTHMDLVKTRVVNGLLEMAAKQFKYTKTWPTVVRRMVADVLCLVVVVRMDRPQFNNQAKDVLTTRTKDFGSEINSLVISDTVLKRLYMLGEFEQSVSDWIESSTAKTLTKTDGKKKLNTSDIPNYTSAKYAGTSKSKNCTLILTEGLSARTMVMSGLSPEQKQYYGVFPLKGKVLNVRDQTKTVVAKNIELTHLKKILGLEHGKVYTDTGSLRYGRVMVMTDADHDGYHIKGLVFNVFAVLWPSLFSMPEFLCSFRTPIVKANFKKISHVFYTMSDYREWAANTETSKWHIKYYKGLGTSTSKEAVEYFSNVRTNTINYRWNDATDEAFDKAFNKTRSDCRKAWLGTYDPHLVVEFVPTPNSTQSAETVMLDKFIDQDLIHFSNSDLARSIPHVYDGLKTSQRKVLFASLAAFGQGNREMKVAQLAGIVSQKSAYHAGEKSLEGCIVGMARDYVGTNNLNWLEPNGQYGGRMNNVHASSRYINTQLTSACTRVINSLDSSFLEWLSDDGLSIEPRYYMPIIPMILVNGALGIGTGFSTSIPCFNPSVIIDYILAKLACSRSQECMDFNAARLIPWYRGFTGRMTLWCDPKANPDSTVYESHGVFTQTGSDIQITELPIGSYVDTYKEWLNANADVLAIKSVSVAGSSAEKVKIDIKLKTDKRLTESDLKLTSKLSLNNMYAFDKMSRIRKFSSPREIIDYFLEERTAMYELRYSYLITKLNRDIAKMTSMRNFIHAVVSSRVINLNLMTSDEIIEYLKLYPDQFTPDPETGSFDWAIQMRIGAMTLDAARRLDKSILSKREELEEILESNPTNLYIADLEHLRELL